MQIIKKANTNEIKTLKSSEQNLHEIENSSNKSRQNLNIKDLKNNSKNLKINFHNEKDYISSNGNSNENKKAEVDKMGKSSFK